MTYGFLVCVAALHGAAGVGCAVAGKWPMAIALFGWTVGDLAFAWMAK